MSVPDPRFTDRSRNRLQQGWKVCVMTVQKTSRTAAEFSTQRQGTRVRGMRCRQLVPPDRIAAFDGIPVCVMHEKQFFALASSVIERNKELRTRLDPGCSVE